MLWALLPFLFLAVILGFTAVARDLAVVTPPAAPFQVNAVNAAAQIFIMYRDAVMAYAEQNPSITGGVAPGNPPLNLSGSAITALQAAHANALIGQNDTTGHDVCVWMQAPAGTVGQVVSQLDGDLTIGTVLAGGVSWMQVGYGGTSQSIPESCEQGNPLQKNDIISVVGLGEN